MKKKDSKLQRAFAEYRISKLRLIAIPRKGTDKLIEMESWCSVLVSGIRYMMLLQKDKQVDEVERVLSQLNRIINRLELRHQIPNIKSTNSFLHNNDDFGEMKPGVE